MPRVLNRHHTGSLPSIDAVYIGRPSKWGNPFTHDPDLAQRDGLTLVDNRTQAVAAYEGWISRQPELLEALSELRGRDLACWCAPLACHGDVLLRLANENDE